MSEIVVEAIHILVIDDSQEICDFVKAAILEPAGYQVTLAADGIVGFQQAQALRPDLILLDYEMPGMNGIEVLQALKAKGIVIPVILITSYGSESVAVEVFRLGVRDYVPKPFAVEEILQSIESVLHTVRLQRERDALFTKLEQTNAQLTQRVKELDTLYHIGKSITTLQDRDKVLNRIVDAALYLTGALEGMLVITDPVTRLPEVKVQRTRDGKEYATLTTEVTLETTAAPLMLSVTLHSAGRELGALTVSNKHNRLPLNPQRHRLLQALGDYAAITLENFRMVDELEARREREKREIRTVFEHYVTPSVVEQLLRQPQNVHPGGARQTIAVMFADLRGFTTFTAKTPPEELIFVLNRHIAAAADMVLQAEGTLDKFMGDEIMAFFNAPLPQADYALRAVQAAWNILRITQQTHQQLPAAQRLDFGIGIATGEAIVGNVGTRALVNFTAVGQPVNKAHALQELAPAGKVLICGQTYALVQTVVDAVALPAVQIKGQVAAEVVYEVRGLKRLEK